MTPGTHLGPYEIVAPLGAGGMGEVYLARDTRLGRDVAVKVLPADVANDADRLRRFDQEARAAAALNHPNLVSLYDIGTEDGVSFMVTELLDGRTLRRVIDEERLSVSRIVDVAAQIADGLAAAHSRDIIHRDIKPENIIVTSDGRAKILDFGLARIAVTPASLDAPTQAATDPHVVLGTAGYMAPEQVRAQPVDSRADVFALGAVLYEMLTGRRAFRGDTMADTISAILREPPPPIAAAADRPIPPSLLRIVDRCLEKTPSARFQSTTDLAFALKSVSQSDVGATGAFIAAREAPARRLRRDAIAWTIAGASLVGMIALAIVTVRRDVPDAAHPAIRFNVPPPDGMRIGVGGGVPMAISPDGRQILFGAIRRGSGRPSLFLRSLDSTDVRPVAAAADISGTASPFWSADGRSIGFWSDGKLRRIDLATGIAEIIGQMPPLSGPAWGPDGTIVFGSQLGSGGGVYRIPATGGAPVQITKPDSSRGEQVHSRPSFLPDGRHFLYVAVGSGMVMAGSLDSPDVRPILRADSQAIYSQGHLIFARQSRLLAQPFDPARLETTGDPIVLVEGVQVALNVAQFAVSPNGVLVFGLADPLHRASLGWIDRTGNAAGTVPDSLAMYASVELAPDGRRAAATVLSGDDQPVSDLFLVDLERSTRARLTTESRRNINPVFSPDGTRLLWSSDRTGVWDLYWKRLDGVGQDEVALRSPQQKFPTDWTSHGIVFRTGGDENTTTAIWVAPDGDLSKAVRYPTSGARPIDATLSPDGRWIAYATTDPGAGQIYVQAFPDPGGGRYPISGATAGRRPQWRADGREIVYVEGAQVIAVPVAPSPRGLDVGTPTPLFRTPGVVIAPTRDHTRFLVLIPEPDTGREIPLTVLVNWTSLIGRR